MYAIDHNISIDRCPTKLEYTYEDKKHYYFPDFLYDGKLLEIKGDQFFKEDGTMQCPFAHEFDEIAEVKHQCTLKNNVIIWRFDDYKFALGYFNSKYSKEDFLIKLAE